MRKFILAIFICLWCPWIYGQTSISGKITDASSGESLAFVTVLAKGSTLGTTSNVDGHYTINVPSGTDKLVFSFIGYANTEIAINSRTTINVALEPENQQLEAAVVTTALGVRRAPRDLGYSLSTIDTKEILLSSPTNFASALYGKAAGLRIATAPGGMGAVSMNIRGVNSISGKNQPLIVVDGIPIRNPEANEGGYWESPRIETNALADINPEDIGDISILKGAAAAVLYGSDAGNGVVLITTKSGKGAKKGIGVDFNMSITSESIAFAPKYQNEFGPGYDLATNKNTFGSDDDGWIYTDGKKHPIYRSWSQFGPRFDGSPVLAWHNNEMIPYVAQKDNYKKFYRNGLSQMYNVAITQNSDNSNIRFSYTHNKYESIVRESEQMKNNFSLNGSFKPIKWWTNEFNISYLATNTTNRPEGSNRIMSNYGGFFSRFDNMDWFREKYKTSMGYLFVTGSGESLTPEENLKRPPRATDLMEYMWRQNENQLLERANKVLGSLTTTFDLTEDLKLRGRIGTDFNTMNSETKERNKKPLVFGNSGYYSQQNARYMILYGDILLMFNKQFGENFSINATAGYQAQTEDQHSSLAKTDEGLSVENWFHTKASVKPAKGESVEQRQTRDAIMGTVGFGFRNYLFLELSGRQDRTSTLYPKRNSFFYPSASASWIFSDMFTMPRWINYGKLRSSYAEVGIPPKVYAAFNAYDQATLNGVTYSSLSKTYSDPNLKPEKKKEVDLGLEMKMFNYRLGFEVSYYHANIVDQILDLSMPATVGAETFRTNVGTLRNTGLEANIYGTPLQTKNFRWTARFNFAVNRNKVVKLTSGIDQIMHRDVDVNSAILVSRVGDPMGDFYVWPIKEDGNGNKIVGAEGLYEIDFTKRKHVGNAMPKIVGGFGSTINFWDFFLDFTIDYRFGGKILSQPLYYMTGAGMFEETLEYRDNARGGISYYIDGGKKIPLSEGNPGNNRVFQDGIILPGVRNDGTPNTTIVDAAKYYNDTHYWSSHPSYNPYGQYEKAIFDNSYIKVREIILGYNLPKKIAEKFSCQNLTFSLIGRNLFYIHKTVPHIDPEGTVGTQWINTAIDYGSIAPTRSLGFSLRASF